MTLPGAGAGRFLFQDYTALISKAERELASLRKGMDADTLFNFVCTVNHLFDWILNDPRVKGTLPIAEAEARDIKKYNPYVKTMRELCNGVKHLDLSKPPRAAPRIQHSPKHWFERAFSSVSRSPWLPLNQSETKFLVDINGKPYDVLDVGEEAMREWRQFLARHGLPA